MGLTDNWNERRATVFRMDDAYWRPTYGWKKKKSKSILRKGTKKKKRAPLQIIIRPVWRCLATTAPRLVATLCARPANASRCQNINVRRPKTIVKKNRINRRSINVRRRRGRSRHIIIHYVYIPRVPKHHSSVNVPRIAQQIDANFGIESLGGPGFSLTLTLPNNTSVLSSSNPTHHRHYLRMYYIKFEVEILENGLLRGP